MGVMLSGFGLAAGGCIVQKQAMQPVLLLDVVGLSERWIGEDTPNLRALGQRGSLAPMSTVLPAVTCSAQATMASTRNTITNASAVEWD